MSKRQRAEVPSALDALRSPGITSRDPQYEKAVGRLREMLYAAPDNSAPRKETRSLAAAIGQSRAHSRWCPEGFNVTRAQIGDKMLFFNLIKDLAHPFAGMEADLPVDVVHAVTKMSSLGAALPRWRESRLELLHIIADSLQPMTDRILRRQSPAAAWATGPAHVAFMCALCDATEWPDYRFPLRQCVSGYQIVGLADYTGIYRVATTRELAHQTEQHVPFKDLMGTNARWNASLRRSLETRWASAKRDTSSRAFVDARKVYAQTIKEREDGLITGPFTFSQMDRRWGPHQWRGSDRFPVYSNDKIRAVDNAKRSGLNRAYSQPEKQVMPRPEFSAMVCKQFAREAAENGRELTWTFGVSNDDEEAAFKSCPSSQPQFTVIVIANPVTGVVECWLPRGVNFGLKASGSIYGRKTAFLGMLYTRFLAVACAAFVDDWREASPSFSRGRQVLTRSDRSGRGTAAIGGHRWPGSGQGAMWRALELLHLPQPKLSKHEPWSEIGTSCGIESDFTQVRTMGLILLRASASARNGTRDIIDRALVPGGCLAPAEAATLKGKTHWALGLGTAGRAALQPLAKRANESAPIGALELSMVEAGEQHWGDAGWRLTPELHASLSLLRQLLDKDLPDAEIRLDAAAEPPVLLLSDAMWRPSESDENGYGRVAWLGWIPLRTGGGKLMYADADAPPDMLAFFAVLKKRKQYICDLEEVALAAPYFAPELTDSLEGRCVLAFADNTAANAGAISGYSSSPAMARILSALHLRWARMRIRPWIEFVKSEANLADNPSRGDNTWAEKLGATRINFTFPPYAGWE
jgi:hypothetical protein